MRCEEESRLIETTEDEFEGSLCANPKKLLHVMAFAACAQTYATPLFVRIHVEHAILHEHSTAVIRALTLEKHVLSVALS